MDFEEKLLKNGDNNSVRTCTPFFFTLFLLVFSLGNVFLEMSLVEVEGNGNQELCEPDKTTFKIRTSKVPQGCKCTTKLSNQAKV